MANGVKEVGELDTITAVGSSLLYTSIFSVSVEKLNRCKKESLEIRTP